MNVGFSRFLGRGGPGLDSLAHVQNATVGVLKKRHTLQPYPGESGAASSVNPRELVKQWLASSDVVVGPVYAFLPPLLRRLRNEMGDRPVPYVAFLLGCMPRGGVEHADQCFRTCDVLVANCEADVALARKFWPNATVRCVPLAYDDAIFYPEDETAQRAVRASLGIGPDEKIVLYAGRVTLEKNVHTLLKVFSVVLNAVPDARLVIAGSEDSIPFVEFGVMPLDIRRCLRRLMTHLGLDERHVIFAGHRTRDDLRALYSTAHVLVNLTLHHDENFGLAQVEAMACGVPIVGTTWGGLKDTVTQNVTGKQVPAVVTATGVKVDWWRAANSIVQLLTTDASNQQLRERCRAVARDRYSMARYGDALDEAVRDAAAAARRPSEPIRQSAFAEEFWATCIGEPQGLKLGTFGRRFYRQGPESLRLYRELITPFAGAAMDPVRPDAECAWCLAAPLVFEEDDTLSVNDPLYPFEVPVPKHVLDDVRTLVNQFTLQPVMAHGSLEAATSAAAEAFVWMQEMGLVIRTCRGTLDTAGAGRLVGAPSFEMRQIDSDTDIVWFSRSAT